MNLIFQILILAIFTAFLSCDDTSTSVLEEEKQALALFGDGIISSDLYERDLAISKDGRTYIYTLGDHKQTRRCLISINYHENRWSKPTVLSFSGKYNDIEPFFSNNDTRLFFASDRPISSSDQSKDYNIWYSDFLNDSWNEPVCLAAHINTEADEFFPSIAKNGNLYFTAAREGGPGREDIYKSIFSGDSYETAVPLDSNINTKAYEFNAYVSPEEDLIIYSSFGRSDDLGGGDLYYSKKELDGTWNESKNMGKKINSDKLDYSPFVDFQQDFFYFTSERSASDSIPFLTIDDMEKYSNRVLNGFGNIFRIKFSKLGIKLDEL